MADAVALQMNFIRRERVGGPAGTLTSRPSDNQFNGVWERGRSAVRRYTPREWERLMGFPDDWTLVPHRGRPMPESPRYEMIGNSVAVPVLRWVGERIAMLEACVP